VITLPDVVIVGAGVIGLATGRELAQRGLSVVIVERGSPAREATWAAAGMLSPLGEAAREPAMFALANASLDLWPALADSLHGDTGADVEYRACGALHIAFDDVEAERLGDLAKRAGDVGRSVDPAEIRELQPALSSEIVSGLLIERDHRVDNRRLGQALWSAAVGAGVELRLGIEVAGVELVDGAFRALVMSNGARLPAGRCVIASGAWSGQLEGLPVPCRSDPCADRWSRSLPRRRHRRCR
jgi:glycine oxidase